MKIRFSDTYGNDVTYEMNDSETAHALERLLPMSVEMLSENNAKYFIPDKKLNTFGAPLAKGGTESLCYHSSWNEIILYYGGYKVADDLYEIGRPIAGSGQIRNLRNPVLVDEL